MDMDVGSAMITSGGLTGAGALKVDDMTPCQDWDAVVQQTAWPWADVLTGTGMDDAIVGEGAKCTLCGGRATVILGGCGKRFEVLNWAIHGETDDELLLLDSLEACGRGGRGGGELTDDDDTVGLVWLTALLVLTSGFELLTREPEIELLWPTS